MTCCVCLFREECPVRILHVLLISRLPIPNEYSGLELILVVACYYDCVDLVIDQRTGLCDR